MPHLVLHHELQPCRFRHEALMTKPNCDLMPLSMTHCNHNWPCYGNAEMICEGHPLVERLIILIIKWLSMKGITASCSGNPAIESMSGSCVCSHPSCGLGLMQRHSWSRKAIRYAANVDSPCRQAERLLLHTVQTASLYRSVTHQAACETEALIMPADDLATFCIARRHPIKPNFMNVYYGYEGFFFCCPSMAVWNGKTWEWAC